MKCWIAAAMMVMGVSGSVLCADTLPKPADIFAQANAAYAAGDYAAARRGYEKILMQDSDNGIIFYNLGNTFFKLGQLGKAIACYERAQWYIPRDSDVVANKEFVISQLPHQPVEEQRSWVVRLFGYVYDGLNISVLAWVLTSSYWMAVVVWCVWLSFQQPSTRLYRFAIGCTVLAVICGGGWFFRWRQTAGARQAVIIAADVDARYAPAEQAVTHFRVYEGAVVQVLSQDPDWVRIKTPDRKIAWVPRASLEFVFAPRFSIAEPCR
ncbi:MAG: tetratricopeptide repeat protein [Candidatus Omnitrophica bacterium]|nr:tetratricopeptide repeat protein [Candidatus Omnitrophota bacterium]